MTSGGPTIRRASLLAKGRCGCAPPRGPCLAPDADIRLSGREQETSDHAAFIDRLSEDGRIPLGGPVGDIDGDHTVLVVHATSENDA
jgi:hypothetical protein